jgi:hypothetical protein
VTDKSLSFKKNIFVAWSLALFIFVLFFSIIIYIILSPMLSDYHSAGLKKNSSGQHVRAAAVAGGFYPAEKSVLIEQIENLLADASSTATSAPAAIIVPHAGYDYSGTVAAAAYKAIAGRSYRRVILVGSSHRNYFSHIAADDHDIWRTPLGEVAVDRETIDQLAGLGRLINIDGQVHESDHVLEVQLPFLQIVLPAGFRVVPLLFGNADDEDYAELARILARVMTADDLLVVSSDLSHYPKYEEAVRIDKETLRLIAEKKLDGLNDHIEKSEKTVTGEETVACGADGIRTAISLAEKIGWQGNILKYANSGDTKIGDKARVVGYGALAFYGSEMAEMSLGKVKKTALLDLAKKTVEEYVRSGRTLDYKNASARLEAKEGAFVTLTINEKLRGCIGLITSDKSLWQTVRDMAIAAASDDPRFTPVTAAELPKLEYEVSVLSEPKKITDWRQIELGRHGVIVRRGRSSGVFLPQVADDTGWTLEEFLGELCEQKAGLSRECYKDPQTEISVFTADVF